MLESLFRDLGYSSAKDYAGIDGILEVESMVMSESDRGSAAGAVE